MYCAHCGKELDNDAKFCIHCGAKVAQEVVDRESNLESETPSCLNEDAGKVEPSDTTIAPDSIEEKPTVNEDPVKAQSSNESSTLKAAVASNRKRSHRRMPLILVVALMLALTASIALAAYYVYTEIYLPQQEAQQQAEAEAEQQTAWDEALKTYQVVLDEYIAAGEEYNSSGTIEYDIETDSYGYQYANVMGIIDYGSAEAVYALDDLNNDGNPELLVSHAEQNNTPGILLGVYTIADNQPKIITLNSWTRNSLVYLDDNQFSCSGSGGFDSNARALQTWNGDYLESEEDIKETLTTVASISYTWIDDNDRGEDDSLYEVTTTTPSGTTKETIPFSELQNAIEEFSQQYIPSNTSSSELQWSLLTN